MKPLYMGLLLLLVAGLCYAHSGRTNEDGCHHNRKKKTYHCHNSKQSTRLPKNYNRSDFGPWIDADRDCQDTRQEVLIEESLIEVTFETDKQCRVKNGKWKDVYTGKIYINPDVLDVDHMVPVAEAFRSGAQFWNKAKKQRYYNDLTNKNHLIAVHHSANRSKQDKDPAHWLPPDPSFHKKYVRTWKEIKQAWDLDMDDDERNAIHQILAN